MMQLICSATPELPQLTAKILELPAHANVYRLTTAAEFCGQVCNLIHSTRPYSEQERLLKQLLVCIKPEWRYIVRGALWRVGMTEQQFKELCLLRKKMTRWDGAWKIGLKYGPPSKDYQEEYRQAFNRVMPPGGIVTPLPPPGTLRYAEKEGQMVAIPLVYLDKKDAAVLAQIIARKRKIRGLLPSAPYYGEDSSDFTQGKIIER
jgi:hypothetical protein